MSPITLSPWENGDAPAGATNTLRGLTHSSDFTREGLAMKATRPCIVDGCDRDARRREFCGAHYARLLRHGSATAGGVDRPKQAETCSVDDCEAQPHGLGLCDRHYKAHLLVANPEYRQRKNDAWRAWAAEHVEQEADRKRRYREATPEQQRRMLADWKAANPWAASVYTFTKRRRRYGLPDDVVDLVDPRVLHDRDEGRCQLCGDPIDFGIVFPDPMSMTIDHVIPVVDPACAHSYENTQSAHWGCNRRKNAVPAELRRLGGAA